MANYFGNPFAEAQANMGNFAAADKTMWVTNALNAASASGINPVNLSQEGVSQITQPLLGQQIGSTLTPQQTALVNQKLLADQEYKNSMVSGLYEKYLKDFETRSARSGEDMSAMIRNIPEAAGALRNWLAVNPNYVSTVDPYPADRRSWLSQNKLKAALIGAAIGTVGFGLLKTIGTPIAGAASASAPTAAGTSSIVSGGGLGAGGAYTAQLPNMSLISGGGGISSSAASGLGISTGSKLALGGASAGTLASGAGAATGAATGAGTTLANAAGKTGIAKSFTEAVKNAITERPVETLGGAYLLARAAGQGSAPDSADINLPANRIPSEGLLELKGQVNTILQDLKAKKAEGLSKEEYDALYNKYDTRRKQLDEEIRTAKKEELIAKGMENSSEYNKEMSKIDRNSQQALKDYELELSAMDAQLKRQSQGDIDTRIAQYQSSLLNLENVSNAYNQAQYENEVAQYLQQLNGYNSRVSGFSNLGTNLLTNVFSPQASQYRQVYLMQP